MCIDIHIYVYICIFAIQFTFVPRKSDMIPLDVYSHDVLKQASPPTPPLRRHILYLDWLLGRENNPHRRLMVQV